MNLTKALIIADPWVGYILDGSKTWEMRSSGASHRGWFGLIRKGTGAVYGVARLIDVGRPLTPAEMIATIDHHRIPESMIRSGEVAKWNTPWKLADVRRLARPVPYVHKSGAVTWVQLDPTAIDAISLQLGGAAPPPQSGWQTATDVPPAHREAPSAGGEELQIDLSQQGQKVRIDIEWDDGEPHPPVYSQPAALTPANHLQSASSISPLEPAGGEVMGEVALTDGNIANNHIYLRNFFDRFPPDAVGGSIRASAALRSLTIDWGGETVVTDLDGTKKLFRARGWIGTFFRINRAQAGDWVVVEQIGPYRYRVGIRKLGQPVDVR